MELVLLFPELDGPDDHPEDEEQVNADDEEYEGDSQGSGSLPDDDHHDDDDDYYDDDQHGTIDHHGPEGAIGHRGLAGLIFSLAHMDQWGQAGP